MPRLRVFLDEDEAVSADLESSRNELPEALIELGRSLARVRDSASDDLKFNDSKRKES